MIRKLANIFTTEVTDSLAASIVFCNPPVVSFTELLTFAAASFAPLVLLEDALTILDAMPLGSCNIDKLSTELPN